MLRLKKIAVTGSLSSGKSTVCKILEALGAYVISADAIVHRLLTPDSILGQKVIDLLGKEVLVYNHIDREKIAKKVFNNQILLKSLEHLIHPEVRKEINKEYKKITKKGTHRIFVAEVPLLFEAEMEKDYDLVILVEASLDLCYERYHDKTGKPEEEFLKRSHFQLSQEEKRGKADMIISNQGSKEDLENQVQKIFLQLL